MNTTNGSFIEKSIPNNKQATVTININGVESTMLVSDFFDQNTNIITPADPNLYNLNPPSIVIVQNPGNSSSAQIFDKTTNAVDPTYSINFGNMIFLNNSNDLTTEQMSEGVWLEMLIYRKRGKFVQNSNPTNNYKRGFVIPSMWEGGVNSFEAEIKAMYGAGIKLKTRGGNSYYNYWDNSGESPIQIVQPLGVDRINHIRFFSPQNNIPLVAYLNSRFIRTDCEYIDNTNNLNTIAITCPSSRSGTFSSFGDSSPSYHTQRYQPKMTNMYIKFRYIMFNKASLTDNNQKQFIEGECSPTIKISPKSFPFAYRFDTTLNKMVNPLVSSNPYQWQFIWEDKV